jgi:hypothetical protein
VTRFDEIEDYLEHLLRHKHRRRHHLVWTIDRITPQGATSVALDLLATDIGSTHSVTATAQDAAGNVVADTIVLSNDNPAVATLTDNGDGTGSLVILASGTANIGASDGTLTAEPFVVTVAAAVPATLTVEVV